MSNSEKTIWSRLESIALIITVGSGVLTGVFTIWGGTEAGGADFADSAANFFVIITAIGGMAMGVLYLRRRLTAAN